MVCYDRSIFTNEKANGKLTFTQLKSKYELKTRHKFDAQSS